jgi:two-component system sensor histidine kinase EvgS
LQLDVAPCNLRKLVLDIFKIHKSNALRKGLTLQFTIDRKLPYNIDIDSARFQQILMNIMSNAIKFTGQGSVVMNVTYKPDTFSIAQEMRM